MKKGQFDVEDVFAILLWVMIIILFLVIINIGGCNKGLSRATITSERENIVHATRTLLNYLNNEVDYENRKVKVSELVSELYITKDNARKDEIQGVLIEKTKQILGNKDCWTVTVVAKPKIVIESDRCKEKGTLEEIVSLVKVTTKLPTGMQSLEVEYQKYFFREREIAGGR